jgi:hypothetical protein
MHREDIALPTARDRVGRRLDSSERLGDLVGVFAANVGKHDRSIDAMKQLNPKTVL